MPVFYLGEMTWPEVRALDREHLVAILPVGAVEAHGPHLPLTTDGIISKAMAKEGARRLSDKGWTALVLPGLDYTTAPFGSDFPGTVSVRPETVTALIVDIAGALADHEVPRLAIANSHLDPAHLTSLYQAVEQIAAGGSIEVVFPDICRKPWALRLTDEFKSGACHAGQYESSVVLAEQPDLVREAERARLRANPVSLSTAIREGKSTFADAGGEEAYFGDPAAASATEGRGTIAALGKILADSVAGLGS